jgi:hypothetical protein
MPLSQVMGPVYLFFSPETLKKKEIRTEVSYLPLTLVTIDEGKCVLYVRTPVFPFTILLSLHFIFYVTWVCVS